MSILSIFKVKEGMILGEPVFSKHDRKLLINQGNRLTKKTIECLKENSIESVEISDRYSIFIKPTETMVNFLEKEIPRKILELAPNIEEANTSDYMVGVSKKSINIVNKILCDEKILNICVQIKLTGNKNLFNHSINTCALSLLVAGAMNLRDAEIYNIGVAALIHDMGLCEMPFLIDKESKLTGQELLLWKEHPTYGYYFSKQLEIDNEISQVIQHHHEFWNGSGFPKGLKGKDIPLGSRIISVCSEYDHLIGAEGLQPYEAIEHIYATGDIWFDKEVIETFTKNIPVYPLGSIVRLTTGEVGVVVNVRKNLGPRPIVKIYYNNVNKPLTNIKTIDLGEKRTIFIKEILTKF